MAIYAVGDVQGCFSALLKLTAQIRFGQAKDRLWFVGDLVNRGPDSLSVLRYVKGLGPSAVVVLGNHDLHLLAVAGGCASPRRTDTFQDVLSAPDRHELLFWLRHRPLIHREQGLLLVHAGLLPQWTATQAVELAQQAEQVLRTDDYRILLRVLFGTARCQWSDDLTGMTRLAAITHAMTRLRVCSAEGAIEFSYKGPPDHAPTGSLPWFQVPARKSAGDTIICGHWAAMGLRLQDNLLALDGGCVWGRQLVAVRLEDRQIFHVSCAG
ncbi:MAG: symmetrical bis(5'-nucleosyl)-tetraphosphatase [Nitrospiraceae bacterium]